MRLAQFFLVAVVAMLTGETAFAQEAAHVAEAGSLWIPVGAGLGLGVAAFGGALGQSRIISAALESIARNPGAADKMFIVWFLGIAFVESLVIYSLVTSLKLLGVW